MACPDQVDTGQTGDVEPEGPSALAQLGELAAVVAHEVRNPLAGLRASLQVIERRVTEARDRSAIAAMIQRIDGLNAKVEDLLLYTRPRPPRRQAVDVVTLVREVAMSAQAATARATSIVVSGEHVMMSVDPGLLRAACANLVLNACQASPHDEVAVRVDAIRAGCRIVVSDRGPGLPAAVRARLFAPFVSTRVNGTGLGLAIVKRLVDLHGGTVRLTDRPDGGTLAEVDLPPALPGAATTAK